MERVTRFDEYTILGNPDAPEGSPEWCLWMRNHIQDILDHHEFDHSSLQGCVAQFISVQGWRHLTDAQGKAFASYESFCIHRRPQGLGIASETIDEIIAERRASTRKKKTEDLAQQNGEAIGPHGGQRPKAGRKPKDLFPTDDAETVQVEAEGEGNQVDELEKNQLDSRQHQGGDAAPYRIRKLRRDHPEIAKRLDNGEFKNVAAAERAARGEDPHPPRKRATPLESLRRAWKKASPDERAAFLKEINA